MKTLYIIHGWTYTVEPWTKTIEILRDKYKIDVKILHVPGLTEQSQKVWTINDYVSYSDESHHQTSEKTFTFNSAW